VSGDSAAVVIQDEDGNVALRLQAPTANRRRRLGQSNAKEFYPIEFLGARPPATYLALAR
jgi:hypothetical protein